MKHVNPEVFCLAETRLNVVGVQRFLNFHNINDWETDAENGAEKLIEIAGRRCYQSWETETVKVTDINPNLSTVRVGNKRYIGNIIKSKHGSVLEHASITYAIENVSRVFTHEMVRHRLCNFSQESLRFVRPQSLNAYFPDVFNTLPNDVFLTRGQLDRMELSSSSLASSMQIGGRISVRDAALLLFKATIEDLEETQRILVDLLGMDVPGKVFGDKKKLQSAMRRLMPIGMATGIIVTSNHRNLRHLISMRTHEAAEEEMRIVFAEIAADVKLRYPAIYQDMTAQMPEDKIAFMFTFENEKV